MAHLVVVTNDLKDPFVGLLVRVVEADLVVVIEVNVDHEGVTVRVQDQILLSAHDLVVDQVVVQDDDHDDHDVHGLLVGFNGDLVGCDSEGW